LGRATENRKGEYRVLVRRPKGKRLPEGLRRRWEYTIKMFLQEVIWEHVLD
jgi:hypothetical protein